MLIHEITSNGKELKYEYDGSILNIKLGNTYAKGEEYTVYIKYTARPEEVEQEGVLRLPALKACILLIRWKRILINLLKSGHKVKPNQVVVGFLPSMLLTKKHHRRSI